MSKEFLTTGEVAVMISVTPDAVLKWIKTGKIPASRTIGGHFRIHRNAIPSYLFDKEMPQRVEEQNNLFQYCWEFNTKNEEDLEECRGCIVYRARAKCCFEMIKLPAEAGHFKKFCLKSCEDCDYYKVHND